MRASEQDPELGPERERESPGDCGDCGRELSLSTRPQSPGSHGIAFSKELSIEFYTVYTADLGECVPGDDRTVCSRHLFSKASSLVALCSEIY